METIKQREALELKLIALNAKFRFEVYTVYPVVGILLTLITTLCLL